VAAYLSVVGTDDVPNYEDDEGTPSPYHVPPQPMLVLQAMLQQDPPPPYKTTFLV